DYYFAMEMVLVDSGESVQCDFELSAHGITRDVTVKGFVEDDLGAPVTSGNVVAYATDEMGSDMPYNGAVVQPDGTGYFELNIIPSDNGGGAILMDYPGYNMASNETDDPLAAATAYWFNITLEPTSYDDDCMIYGQVWDGSMNNIAGAVVSIRTENEWGGGSSNYTFSGPNGYFFLNATNGSAEVTWAKGGYTSYQINIDISSGQSREWNPSLFILDGMMRGNVTDLSTGLPIDGARVMQIVSGVDWARSYSMAMTDATGAYELGTFGASGEGVYVMAEAEGYSRDYTQMDMPSGADLWMDFGLWPIDCAVTGEVTDAVSMAVIEGAGIYIHNDNFEAYMESAANGSFYADMVSGTYDVEVWMMDYKNYVDTVDLTSGVLNWYNISLVPYVNSVVEGTVTNFYNGTPVEGATVEVWGPTYQTTTTETSGWYELNLPDGDYSIRVTASDYEDYTSTVTAPELGTETHDVDLIPNEPPAECRLHGNTTDESGTAGVPWVTVRVSIVDSEYENYTSSNETGVYEIWVPNYGDVRVTASASGYMATFDIIDTTGVLDYDLQLPMAVDSVTPVVDLSVDPAESVSVYNPATVSGVATDADLRNLDLYVMLEYNATADFANYTMIEMRESTTDPYDFNNPDNLAYSKVGDDYIVDFQWDGTVANILMLDDGAISHTLMYWQMWFGPEQYYAVSGRYSNLSADTDGYMLFNLTTGALEYFMPWDYPATPISLEPLDAGTFAPMAIVLEFSAASGWAPFGGTWTNLEPMDVSTMAVSETGLVLGGACKIGLIADDWAGHSDYVFVNLTVDNTPPVADAGPDFDGVIDTDVVVDGSSSSDNVGVVSYSWSIEDPSGFTVVYTDAVVTLSVTELGNYVCELTVTDAAGYSDVDTVIVTGVPDALPTADAGADVTTPEDVATTFDGSASGDDVGIDNYTWYIAQEDSYMYGVAPEYTFADPGIYNVTLTVTDTIGQVSDPSDEMVVTVEDTTVPVADAGADLTVDMDATTELNASASTDNGVIDSYIWTFDDWNGSVTLDGAIVNHVFTVAGDYVVTLNVTDTYGNWATDTMTVTVEDTEAPVADAGEDQTVDMGGEVTFDGAGSADNVGVVNYTWTFDDGGDITLYEVDPAYTFENAGTFVVTLTATDAMGNTGTDTMTVTVNDLVDPVADAGEDADITAGDTHVFDGSGSSDNLGIASYVWTFTDGDDQELTGVSPDYEFLNVGEFEVTLTVTDAAGNSDTDTVTIRVVEGNAAPMADAGPDQTVEAGDTVEFDGLESMDDGEIVNYTWTFLYDGETVTLYGSEPTFAFEIAGEYTVTLTVEDDEGATDTDTVTITVEEKAGGLFEDYWWVLLVVVVVGVVGVAAFMLMKKGGAGPGKPESEEPAPPEDEPAPPEDEEL
ncbi:MAG: PKD domain-containing protein, partial [Thermoplasmata archaeon]|nr:PKD domain-containing protein [Thermoplasmata archaeon]